MSRTIESPPAGLSPLKRTRRPNSTLVVLYLALGSLAFTVLQSTVAPALTAIAHDLDASTNAVGWVLTAYLLSASVLTPIMGRLGDMVGKRRMLIIVLVLLLAGTVLAALAPNLGVLIVARVIQGISGAIGPLSLGIVRDELPPEKIGVTIGFLSAIAGIGVGAGILVAGPIVENFSWHWLFWFPVILIVIALLGVVFGMRESPVLKPGRLDMIGSAVLSVALVSVLLAVSEGQDWGWGSAGIIGLLVLCVLSLVTFVFVELRAKEPLIDLRLAMIRGVWTANVSSLASGFLMFGVFVLMPPLLQLPSTLGYGFGLTVTAGGLFVLPAVVMMTVTGPIAGVVVRRVGPKPPMLFGAILAAAAFVLPAIAHDQLWQIVVCGIVAGTGFGFAFAGMANAIIDSVPANQMGESMGVNAIARTVGSSIAAAVIAALMGSHTTAQGLPTDEAFTIGFSVCVAVGLLGIAAAVASPSMRQRRKQALAIGVTDFPGESS